MCKWNRCASDKVNSCYRIGDNQYALLCVFESAIECAIEILFAVGGPFCMPAKVLDETKGDFANYSIF